MPSRRHFPHRPNAWWRATITEFHRSGQSPETFARSINAHPATVLRWCKVFETETASVPGGLTVSPPRFVEVAVTTVTHQREPAAPPRAVVEAQVGALSLRVLADTDPVFAGTLLAALAKAVAPC